MTPTPPAPSSLAADLLVRGVGFNPRFVRPTRLPRWPRIGPGAAEGVVVRFSDGVVVIPPVRGKDDPAALRLRDVRGEVLLRDGAQVAGSVTLLRMPPGLGDAAPSRLPFASFLAPLPGVLAAALGGDASFAGPERCRFCPAGAGASAPTVADLAEGLSRFGRELPLHLCLCCRHRYDPGTMGAALETAAAVLGPVPLSVEIPPAGQGPLRDLAARGVTQLIVPLDAPSPRSFLERCPGRAVAVGWERLRRQVDDGLSVFGAGNVGVRMVLFPGDGPEVFPLLRKLASSGAVPIVIPHLPEGGATHGPGELRALAGKLAAAGRGRSLPIDPYAGRSLPFVGAALPIPWYRRLLGFLGIGARGER